MTPNKADRLFSSSTPPRPQKRKSLDFGGNSLTATAAASSSISSTVTNNCGVTLHSHKVCPIVTLPTTTSPTVTRDDENPNQSVRPSFDEQSISSQNDTKEDLITVISTKEEEQQQQQQEGEEEYDISQLPSMSDVWNHLQKLQLRESEVQEVAAETLVTSIFQTLSNWSMTETVRNKMIHLGAIPILLDYMKRNMDFSSRSVKRACLVLFPLSRSSDDAREAICTLGGIQLFVNALTRYEGEADVEESVCFVLANIAGIDTVQVHSSSLANTIRQSLSKASVLDVLFQIINHSHHPDALAGVFKALWNISYLCQESTSSIVQWGGIECGLKMVETYPDNQDLIQSILGMIANITCTEHISAADRDAIGDVVLDVMIKFGRNSEGVQENACIILQNLYHRDHQTRQQRLLNSGCLTILSSLAESDDVSQGLRAMAIKAIHCLTKPHA